MEDLEWFECDECCEETEHSWDPREGWWVCTVCGEIELESTG